MNVDFRDGRDPAIFLAVYGLAPRNCGLKQSENEGVKRLAPRYWLGGRLETIWNDDSSGDDGIEWI